MINSGLKLLFFTSTLTFAFFTVTNKKVEELGKTYYQSKRDTISDSLRTEIAKYWEEENKYWTSLCEKETKKAQNDIQNNELTYVNISWNRNNKEFYNLLKENNIKVDSALHYCMAPSELQHCYATLMENEISKRFGHKFIDSLRLLAQKQYVKNNPNRIFTFMECDYISRYPNDNNKKELSKKSIKDFWSNVSYPEDFEFKKEVPYSYMSAAFVIYKTGEISDVRIDLHFQNKKNYKYSSYFINHLKQFVQNTKWVPATSLGTKVNSEMNLTIHFK
ncbi:hypothetical protein ASG31_13660 [Chryseobacterium sp. Leaf404]|uniref:hypothetical protein n=1 Tax=unclassified Chryseobacterium TaxID=2593645 RepID=UPI0006FBBDA6|nr:MULTISPECIES: hypothetical protein [unclassified Chryseobacterium]KQT16019.1 hypothetical protein ASG31_13660 [Chryseobacterium sp. Leaf404]